MSSTRAIRCSRALKRSRGKPRVRRPQGKWLAAQDGAALSDGIAGGGAGAGIGRFGAAGGTAIADFQEGRAATNYKRIFARVRREQHRITAGAYMKIDCSKNSAGLLGAPNGLPERVVSQKHRGK